MPHDSYAAAGVRTTADAPEFASLTDQIRRTFAFAPPQGRPLLDLGYYANILDLGATCLAVSMDGVGTKIILAQQAGDYSGIGHDLVAMNVNDLLCVGANPIALLDYIAVESLGSRALPALAASLVQAAEEAGISIPGGEVAQVRELITSHAPGEGFDIVGTALGILDKKDIMVGEAIQPGDIILGLASSGLHSNGFTLARQVLLADGWTLDTAPAELGHSLAHELLMPTSIYVKLFREIWNAELSMHAAFHMTGEGLLNLLRVPQPVALELTAWPEIPPVFRLIQERGQLPASTMWTTYNMGIGMILILPPTVVSAVTAICQQHAIDAFVLGTVRESATAAIFAPCVGVRSQGHALVEGTE